MIPKIFKYATSHWTRIRMMMERFGQATPNKPTIPDEKTRVLRARLIMEEALETIEKGLGVSVTLWGLPDAYSDGALIEFNSLEFQTDKDPDINEVADGCADLSVVTIGTLIAFGLPDEILLQSVDDNNLDKVERGRVDAHGKFEKHPNHQPPDIEGIINYLKLQLRGEDT